MQNEPEVTVQTTATTGRGVTVERRFTEAGVHPFDAVEWEVRTAEVGSFKQEGVEFPKAWSQNATNIVAQKYFRGQLGAPERESSVRQMVGRVAGTIAGWGREGGYFASADDGDAFEAELTHILLHQIAAFNSPVWFNVGFEEHPQCSACFILSVQDTMESILDWNTQEGMIFRGGSGSGINLSNIRSSKEHLSKGGLASGPVSFMRGADAWAGTIKSGGKTRRAAKMVVLDVDHPDILDFVWCKAREEEKAGALRDAGFDMSIDGDGFTSIQYQNANNSVRVTDEFMDRAERGEDWELTARVDGRTVETLPARDVLDQIADAAWRCADPGMQYDTTINDWHTCPNSGRINASNPCCFVGETLVQTAHGPVRFDELHRRFEAGEELPTTWAFVDGTPQMATISRVWVAGTTDRLVEVTTDEGETLRCTPEHRFLLQDGRYVEAQALAVGAELRAVTPAPVLVGAGGRGEAPSFDPLAGKQYVAKVREVKLDRPVRVFDLEAPLAHNFTVTSSEERGLSGVVVHNSEYMHVDDSACNLASLNLMKFRREDGSFDVDAFEHAVDIVFLAQEIVVSPSSYPTRQIGENARAFRQLGLGYANLGAYLMSNGLPYDSDEGRAVAGAITALMTGRAYRESARIAGEATGPYDRYEENRDPHLRVMRKHRDAAYALPEIEPVAAAEAQGRYGQPGHDELVSAARRAWDEAVELGEEHGYRNAQATVLAPTGCLVGDSLISTSRGLVRLRSLGDPVGAKWQDLDVQVATDDGPRSATQFYVNGFEQVVSIQTSRGYRIQGTPTHRIKVVDSDGEWVWRRFGEIAQGDRVPLMLGGIVGEPQEVVLPPLGDLHWNADFRTRVPRTVTPELAELVGYFMGDGSLHAKGIRLCVDDKDAEVVDRLVELGAELFGLDAHVSQQKGYTEVAFHSVPLTIWWEACGFAKLPPSAEHSGKGWHAHIPDAILHVNDPAVYAAFIRGLFEADGTTNNGYVSWSTVTESFSRDVQSLLLTLGFVTTRKVDDASSNWGEHERFVLRLLNVASGGPFLAEIGFISDRKTESLFVGQHRQAARHDHIPVGRELIDELASENDSLRKTMLMALARRGDVSRRSATALLERVESHPELEHLLDFYYDTVATKEVLDDQPTYDLSVPDNVTYVANGFVSHNTISFLMDCDTTGIEPDFSLVKFKELVGGGQMTIVNRTVPLALQTLGYGDHEIEQIEAHVNEQGKIVGAPALREEHLPVFDVAVGERAISHMGHIQMMAAAQPFISGAISKTVNLPESATVADISDTYMQGWKLGLKALAIYRDGSKTAQALRTDAEKGRSVSQADIDTAVAEALASAPPRRRRMPRERTSITHKFSVAGHEGYITAGMYDDGTVGEIFLTDVGKEGSTLRGMMNAFATSVSIALQYGVPLETLVRKFSYMRFDPEGITGNPEIPFAKSLPDYIMRWLASKFLDVDIQEELGILTPEVRARKEAQEALMRGDTAGPASGGNGGNGGGAASPQAGGATATPKPAAAALTDEPPVLPAKLQGLDLGPACGQCGGMMQRTGSCYTCSSCGNNTGCG